MINLKSTKEKEKIFIKNILLKKKFTINPMDEKGTSLYYNLEYFFEENYNKEEISLIFKKI